MVYEVGMRLRFLTTVLLLLAGVNSALAEGKTYKWLDEDGVVHYGDSVPPQYAKTRRAVLNQQGVQVGVLEAQKTPEQLAEEARQRALEEQRERDKAEKFQRDGVLLATYLSVEEIELLRDRRLDILQAQETITDQYLATLRTRMATLEKDSQGFKPYNAEADAPPIPTNLAQELMNTLESINNYERRLANNRHEQALLRNQFELDIVRFRELKRLEHAAKSKANATTLVPATIAENPGT